MASLELPFDSPQIVWCQTTDLVSLLHGEEKKLQIYRLGEHPFLLLEQDLVVKPSSFCFDKNGNFSAIGFKNGGIQVIKSN